MLRNLDTVKVRQSGGEIRCLLREVGLLARANDGRMPNGEKLLTA